MDTILFTLCSNNYLPYAKVLGDSILKFQPNAKFIIGLVDRIDQSVDYSYYQDFEILPCLDIGYSEFSGMLDRYNIIEFNTAVKPFYLEYLFRENPHIVKVFYLDPDLFFYQSPEILEREFGNDEILLTPNLIYTSKEPSIGEFASLRHGMYNLGFIGLKRGTESFRLIKWWKERLLEHCRIDKCNGVFVDQKWIDLAPLFFNKIKLVKHPGWNMAWWNFNERKLLNGDQGYSVNDSLTPLVFFHFSGFRPEKTQITERLTNSEFNSANGLALTKLFKDYRVLLLENGYNRYSKVNPGLSFSKATHSLWNQIGRKIKSKVSNLIYRIFNV